MKKSGFTLIELLVVISIISVLSTVGFTTYQGVQSKARDSIRKGDLTKLATALEIYAQQHNLTYIGTPQSDGSCSLTSDQLYTDSDFARNINGPVPRDPFYTNPTDPNTKQAYLYVAENKCQIFRLFAKLENCTGSGGNLCSDTSYNYSVVSDNTSLASASVTSRQPAPPPPAPAPPPPAPAPAPAPPPPPTGSPPPPAFVASAQSTNLSWTQDCGSGGNRMLIVTAANWRADSNMPISDIRYSGTTLTKLGQAYNTSTGAIVAMYYLINPRANSNTITVTASTTDLSFGSSCWSGVSQTAPGNFTSAIGNSTTPSVTITSATGDMVIDGVSIICSQTLTTSSGQTVRATASKCNSKVGHSSKAGDVSSTAMSWTNSGGDGRWAIVGATLTPTSTPPPPPAPAPPSIGGNNTSYNMKVLVLKYFPLTANGQNIDIRVTGDVGGPYTTVRQSTIDDTNNIATSLQKGSSYLLYSNPQALPSLRYSIVDTKEFTQAVPFDSTTRRPLYMQILNGVNVCDYVNSQGVNEVWLWAYQGSLYPGSSYPYLNISESKMSGPYGDISNSYRGNDMPQCQHTYRLYTFNYNGAGIGGSLHSWGHQLEAEMGTVDGNLWSLFQGPHNGRNSNLNTRCGDVHSPPNATGDYNYANTSPWNSDCLNWTPDNLGTLSAISCSNWGCNGAIDTDNPQLKYLIWMFQNIPGMNNTKTYQGTGLRNWWDVHGDFDNVMGNSRRLTL